ncbi:MAG: lipoprotein, partial [Flavobacteriaceae bacterium]|nr:lipoprotein [Flavobacteriaceae bacterium]
MKKIVFLFVVVLLVSSCSKSLSKEEKSLYTEQGKVIAQATAKKLGGTLVKKMKEGGVKDALPFCNENAIPLTKEMSEKYNVTIKRTSHRLRND